MEEEIDALPETYLGQKIILFNTASCEMLEVNVFREAFFDKAEGESHKKPNNDWLTVAVYSGDSDESRYKSRDILSKFLRGGE